MLSSFPSAWLVLGLPFASAAAIAHTRSLSELSAQHHRIMWTVGVGGLGAFAAGLVGLLPGAWTPAAVLVGGAIAGFACFWPARSNDDGDDWRRWSPDPDEDPPPPSLPDAPTLDWEEFDRLRARWADRPRVSR